jgi:uncharacterized protein (DUF486 family)
MPASLTTILLLLASNILMTLAWYGHLKFLPGRTLWVVILISWGIAFFEYCLAVPANRIGYGVMSGFQLKILQEVITLFVFSIFATWVLAEKLTWNYAASFLCLIAAAWFAFGFPTTKSERQAPAEKIAEAHGDSPKK